MIQNLTEFVLIITGFNLLLLATVLISQKTAYKLNRNLLLAFLLCKTILIMRWSFFQFKLLDYQHYPYIYHISCAGFFLLAPLLFLYIRSLCYKDFVLHKSQLIHIIPFLLIIMYKLLSVDILLANNENTNTLLYKIFIIWHNKIFWAANLIQILFYIMAMLKTVKEYRSQIENIYSTIDKINLNWLFSLLLIIFLHWLFVTSRSLISVLDLNAGMITSVIDLFSITIFLVFTTVLVFKGLNQLKIFSGITERSKYANSGLSDEEVRSFAHKLIIYMKEGKPYLDPALTLETLAQELEMNSWDLSRVLNDYFKQSFFNFVNSFRVEEAQRCLSGTSNGEKTILQVLYEAGFNSKSAFNLAFKKHTGITPTEYKYKHHQKQYRFEPPVSTVSSIKNRPAL